MARLRDVIITGLITGAAIGLVLELLLASVVSSASQLSLIVSLAQLLFAQTL